MKLHIKTQDIELVYEDECSNLYSSVAVDILNLIDKIRDHKTHNNHDTTRESDRASKQI